MTLFIPGPAGRLEASLWTPGDKEGPPRPPPTPRAAAVICHPHPLHGGTLQNNVVFRISRALQAAGLAVLRFNFRGAGESEGTHDGGPGEVEDARAGLDWMQAKYPGLPLWAGGFSFGARTTAELAARDERVACLVAVALPCLAFDCSIALEVTQPGIVMMAGSDDFGTAAALSEMYPQWPANLEVDEIPGVDHFFKGQTPQLEARLRAWAGRMLAT